MKITTTCNNMEENFTTIIICEGNPKRKYTYCVSPFIKASKMIINFCMHFCVCMFYFSFRKCIIKESRGCAKGWVWGKEEEETWMRSKYFIFNCHFYYQKNIVSLLYLCSIFSSLIFTIFIPEKSHKSLAIEIFFVFFHMHSALQFLKFTNAMGM